MADVKPSKEVYIPFDAPNAKGKECKTYAKVIGDLETATATPLIGLHGGPGAGHEYLNPLADLWEKYGIPIILYDQVGCGRSTHFRERMGDDEFWTFDLFIKELDNLVDYFKLRDDRGFSLFGQSWGGMFGPDYAAMRPKGLKKFINASGPASVLLYQQGCDERIAELPEAVQKTLEDCKSRGDFTSKVWEEASNEFYKRFFCLLDPFPADVMIGFKHLEDDPTSYTTMAGPCEFIMNGNFTEWVGWEKAHNIEAETLLLNGEFDEVKDSTMLPWFKHIPKVKWVTLPNAAHMHHYEQREKVMKLCGDFLTS